MTEKEKMLAGLVYDADNDPELIAERASCKDLCHDYNLLRPSNFDEQQTIIRQLFAATGNEFFITAPFWCDYGHNITIGEKFYANHNLVILDGAPVSFGANVFIGPNCGFYTAGHPLDAAQRALGIEVDAPITVGDNVWFGGGVQVLPGVTIGNNTVIGSGSVVTKDIPDGVIAVGNPCKVLREITEADIIEYFE
ncbi:sugar O-acetyltransferase [Culicoidibacter larvae]|uniref:Acetyltransferase n=1 Tax=Culicoidibacter larvae TaxID=2579976 RepID=A0A5R8Q9J0_9FIRM|nr:sugar O-acetyltransferase [Culicoidibacter larvae]